MTYYLKVAGSMEPEHYTALASGSGYRPRRKDRPATVREVRRTDKNIWLESTITEGKNRQVRRMCEAINRPVRKLVRIRIGDYALGSLPIGEYASLGPADLRKLLRPSNPLDQRRSTATG